MALARGAAIFRGSWLGNGIRLGDHSASSRQPIAQRCETGKYSNPNPTFSLGVSAGVALRVVRPPLANNPFAPQSKILEAGPADD
jgi:hypothetical protein